MIGNFSIGFNSLELYLNVKGSSVSLSQENKESYEKDEEGDDDERDED